MDRDIIDILNLHFRCLGEPVTCTQVKPFLPALLIPAQQIRIPTPITVHIDHCRPCAGDLAALRTLGLTPGQLERLGRLFAEKPAAEPLRCRQARLKIPAFAAGTLAGIPSELLHHLCACPDCRAQVFQHRQKLLEAASPAGSDSGVAACRDVSLADVFDYAVAYELAESGDPQAKPVQRPSGSHVRTCRQCLERVQALHCVLYSVAERPDSGVATVYTTAKDTKAVPAADDPYPNYPISVQVVRRPAAAARPRRHAATAAVAGAAAHPRLKPWLKIAVAVAAVIPLAILFLSTPTATGITLGQVVKAFGRAENVYVSRLYAPTGELRQELWISRPMNFLVTRQGPERIVYDLGAGTKHVSPAPQMPPEIAKLTEREYTNVRRLIDSCLGFRLSDVPPGSKWTRVDDGIVEGVEVYELTYAVANLSALPGFYRRRITVDPVTALPREIQDFSRRSDQEEWSYTLKSEFRYLTENEMAVILEGQQLSGIVY